CHPLKRVKDPGGQPFLALANVQSLYPSCPPLTQPSISRHLERPSRRSFFMRLASASSPVRQISTNTPGWSALSSHSAPRHKSALRSAHAKKSLRYVSGITYSQKMIINPSPPPSQSLDEQ